MKTKKHLPIRTFKQYIRLSLYLIKKSIALTLAIALANLKQKAFNKRFYVILDQKDRLITLNNAEIKHLKQKGYLSKHLNHLDILEKSFYYTPATRNDTNRLTPEQRLHKRKLYLNYCKLKSKLMFKY